jgi:hypothetical protein
VQPDDGQRLETMWLAVNFDGGPEAVIRGAAAGIKPTGHPFWVHGSEGTIRGDVDASSGDHVELDTGTGPRSFKLTGCWFPDAFAGPMIELLGAIIHQREPENSLSDHLRTAVIARAACDSALAGGAPVLDGFGLHEA